jgi:hypothetical protein
MTNDSEKYGYGGVELGEHKARRDKRGCVYLGLCLAAIVLGMALYYFQDNKWSW